MPSHLVEHGPAKENKFNTVLCCCKSVTNQLGAKIS